MIAVCIVLFVAIIVVFFASGAFRLDAVLEGGGRVLRSTWRRSWRNTA